MKSIPYQVKRLTLLVLMFLAFGQTNAQQDTLRVLFVGNSFIYFYNLPQVVTSMAESQGFNIETRQSTVGGSNLEQHWKGERGTRTRQMLEDHTWDYVVFNNHSMSSIETPESFMEYGKKFAQLVREKGAEPVFMITWAYKSNPLMQSTVTKMYERLCAETHSDLVPCGPLFAQVRDARPEFRMFHDDKHPSSNGTYLLGLAFFKYFTGASTADIPKRLTTIDRNGEKLYLIFMSQEDADFLQELVDEYDFKTRK